MRPFSQLPESFGQHGRRTVSLSNIAAARAVDREFNYNFGSNLGLFGSWLREGFQRTRRARRIHLGRFSAQAEPRRPFHAQNNRLCATGSNSGAPGSQEIPPLTSRTALEQRSVSWGSHLSVFCLEQSHGDLFRDQNVPHIELKLFLNSSCLRSSFFSIVSYYSFFFLFFFFALSL